MATNEQARVEVGLTEDVPAAGTHAAERRLAGRQKNRSLAREARWQRIWELHLRGWPRTHVARVVGCTYATVSRVIARHYHDIGYDREATLKAKLATAVERMRHVQRQAWADHDEDAEHERQVLALMGMGPAAGADGGEKREIVPLRYQSQRAYYLRVILDAEREIARLEGLYEGLPGEGTAFILLAESVEAGGKPSIPLPADTVVDADP